MTQQLRIDPIRCDGYGLCAEEAPDLVWLDDWGYPVVADWPVASPELLRQARRAVDACPVLALRLRRIDADASTAHGPARPTRTIAGARA